MAAKAVKAPKEKKVGVVEHYYPKVHAASVGLQGDLKLGDQVHIVGHGDDLRENVVSMQIDHKPIKEGHAGDHIGLEVPWKVHKKAEVFKVEADRPAAKKAAKKAGKPAKAAKKPARKAAAKKAPKRAKAARKPARKAAKKPARKAAAKKAPKRAKAAKDASRKAAKKAGRK
jgi:translation elongation factor EF-1alpha